MMMMLLLLSCIWLFVTPWTVAHQAPLSSTISQSLLKFMSTESVILFNHLILCHPLLLLPSIFPSIRVFFNESALCIGWPKYWSFSFSISPSNEYSGLISLGWTGWITLQSKGLSTVFSTTIQKHQFFGVRPSLWSNLSYAYMTTGKTIALTRWTLVGKVMSLLFKMDTSPSSDMQMGIPHFCASQTLRFLQIERLWQPHIVRWSLALFWQ